MKIIMSGGGTAGSVSPLLSIYTEIKHKNPDAEFLFVGTLSGEPEKILLRGYSMQYKSIYSGKFRRYFDVRNIIDLFKIFIGFIQSLFIIFSFKPDVIVSAGGFVAVPLVWAGFTMSKKIHIHQQDVKISLSSILTMNTAYSISVAFEQSLRGLPKKKSHVTGNPFRKEILHGNKKQGIDFFGLEKETPTILCIGGGTGAQGLNTLIFNSIESLVEISQIIHVTGEGKSDNSVRHDRYHQYEFLQEEMKHAFAVADIIISRAGLSSLTELSILEKPVIIIPLPHSHQEKNAKYYGQANAAIVLDQEKTSSEELTSNVSLILGSETKRNELKNNIKRMMRRDASEKIAQLLYKAMDK